MYRKMPQSRSRLSATRSSRSSRRTLASSPSALAASMNNSQRSSAEHLIVDAILNQSLRSTASSIARVCCYTGHQARARPWLRVRLQKLWIVKSLRLLMDLRFLTSMSEALRRKFVSSLSQQRRIRRWTERIRNCTLLFSMKSMQFVAREGLSAVQALASTSLSSTSSCQSLMVLMRLTIFWLLEWPIESTWLMKRWSDQAAWNCTWKSAFPMKQAVCKSSTSTREWWRKTICYQRT